MVKELGVGRMFVRNSGIETDYKHKWSSKAIMFKEDQKWF